MTNSGETNFQPKSKHWYKTWWGVVLLLAFWPLSLSYWLWKKREWNIKLKVGLLATLWGLIIFGLISGNTPQKSFKGLNSQSTEAKLQTEATITSPSPQSTHSTEPEPFEASLGNNAVAAKYSKQFFDLANKAAPGYILSIRLELVPETSEGRGENEYKKSITSAFLTVQVDNLTWDTTGEAAQKDLVVSFLNTLKNTFSGFPHVYINNGTRTVVEGKLSLFGEPEIELK